jgi:hypothetical protein
VTVSPEAVRQAALDALDTAVGKARYISSTDAASALAEAGKGYAAVYAADVERAR